MAGKVLNHGEKKKKTVVELLKQVRCRPRQPEV